MINRRNWIRLTGYGVFASLFSLRYSNVMAQNNTGVLIKWLGHSCFLFTGDNLKVLSNPFQPLGCTANYPAPTAEADAVMISSRLLDEGAVEILTNNPQLMVESGTYQVKNTRFQGINTFHDRVRGRRFGENLVWRWNQGGVNIVHLGGIASLIDVEQKILMGTPDLVFIPVGGGAKNYNPQEAIDAIKVLSPKMVIPTQYLTNKAENSSCELAPVADFLKLAEAEGMNVRQLSTNQITVKPQDLRQEGTLVRVFSL